MPVRLNDREERYLLEQYSKTTFDSPTVTLFLNEIYEIMRREIGFAPECSLIDMGCGRGYFVGYLRGRGHASAEGIDPCRLLLDNRITEGVTYGSFEDNSFPDNSFDIAFTCHTLHHLRDRDPRFAVKEMLRVARKYVVIVEINNTNLPVFLTTLAMFRVERNAAFYNRAKVVSMMERCGVDVVFQANLLSCYISGDSLFYRFLASVGSRPYNIVIGRKVT
jgi:ubiquinone/menaquinone biosynthesis C-methylase UbiE